LSIECPDYIHQKELYIVLEESILKKYIAGYFLPVRNVCATGLINSR